MARLNVSGVPDLLGPAVPDTIPRDGTFALCERGRLYVEERFTKARLIHDMASLREEVTSQGQKPSPSPEVAGAVPSCEVGEKQLCEC